MSSNFCRYIFYMWPHNCKKLYLYHISQLYLFQICLYSMTVKVMFVQNDFLLPTCTSCIIEICMDKSNCTLTLLNTNITNIILFQSGEM